MIALGYLLGSIVTAAASMLIIRRLRERAARAQHGREFAELDRAIFGLNLLRAWDDIDRLRQITGQAPLPRQTLADLSRTARCQEDPCSPSNQS